MSLCQNGLHEKTEPGLCPECRAAWKVRQRAAQARYRRTPKGFATDRKYARSAKSRAAKREWKFLHPN